MNRIQSELLVVKRLPILNRAEEKPVYYLSFENEQEVGSDV